MLITTEDIRKCRPIAENIGTGLRVEPYIEEAEQLYLLPEIGAALYKELTDFVAGKTDAVEDIIPQEPNRQKAEFTLLFEGGFYADSTEYFAGLTAALAYLAYSRMVRNQSVNVTAFGVVYKSGELSVNADTATVARISNEAEKIGIQHLRDCKKYLQYLGFVPCIHSKVSNARFRVL